MANRKKAALLGKSGRLDAMAEALARSPHLAELHILSEVSCASLEAKGSVEVGDSADPGTVRAFIERVRPDFAVIGPEEPLAAGIVDELALMGVPCVGPTKQLARIETSKAYARGLLRRYGISGNPEHRVFSSDEGLAAYLAALGEYVIKPDGLTGGKGVKVFGDHLASHSDSITYCRDILRVDVPVIVEEKLIGEEFSFQSFCDGETLRHMPAVQDHKRLLVGDKGPNTGGMGSYSCADHSLPFLKRSDIEEARAINEKVAGALKADNGLGFKGVLYGSFIVTARGLRVIEFNARFGDPEALNVLPILETDFVDVCEAIVDGNLHSLDVRFASKATVCKYVVPSGYPTSRPHSNEIIVPSEPVKGLKRYFGGVQSDIDGKLIMTGSRAVAFVGIGESLSDAERTAELGADSVTGDVYHRHDIGTATLVASRVQRVSQLRSEQLRASPQWAAVG